MRVLIAVLAMLVLMNASVAAAPSDPNVVDPLGDAGPNEVPVPGATDWGDITAVWFEGETETGIAAKVEVAAASTAPPAGEVAIRFAVGEAHFIAGWTTVPFPAPPFVYQGGFICDVDAAFVADPAKCYDLADVAVASDVYSFPLPRERIGAMEAGATIERLSAYADAFAFDSVVVHVDDTADGTPYTFTTGRAADSSAAPGDAPAPSSAPAPADGDPPAAPEAPPRTSEEAPAFPLPLATFALLVGLAFIRTHAPARNPHRYR